MSYKAARVEDAAVTRELANIARESERPSVQFISFAKTYVAPANPFDGMTVYADGTTWNPGFGEGIYAWHGAAWNLLG